MRWCRTVQAPHGLYLLTAAPAPGGADVVVNWMTDGVIKGATSGAAFPGLREAVDFIWLVTPEELFVFRANAESLPIDPLAAAVANVMADVSLRKIMEKR